jgi:hypothetical protein
LLAAQADAARAKAILRKTIQDLQQGKPDFSTVEPELQDEVKEQAQHTADTYQHFGARFSRSHGRN